MTLEEEEGEAGGFGEGERGRTEETHLLRTARVMIWGYESYPDSGLIISTSSSAQS